MDSEVCQVLEKIGNLEAVKKIIESFSEGMNQKVITKSSLLKNSQQLQNAFGMVVGKTTVEKIWISLGINIELSKERKEIGILEESPAKEMIINQIDEAAGVGEIKQPSGLEAPGDKLLSDTQSLNRVRVLAVYGGLAKKVEVDDFVKVIDFFSKPWAMKTFQNVHWLWLVFSYLIIISATRFLNKKYKRNFA